MYISDIIQTDVWNWEAGDIVIIDAPTGAGKTTAVLQDVRCEAVRRGKEVLLISNRRLLKKQLQRILGDEINWPEDDDRLYAVRRFSGITVVSYQEIQAKVKMGQRIVLNDYSHVVFDEFHYLLADAMFQPEIYFFLKWLERCAALRNKVLMLISATPDETWQFLKNSCKLFGRCTEQEVLVENDFLKVTYLCELDAVWYEQRSHRKCWHYRIPQDFANINPIFYREVQSLVDYIICDESTSKWLIFISQKKSGQRMYERLVEELGADEVLFLSAESLEQEATVVEEIVAKQYFSQKVLITTKVLENGVSLNDDELRNIVISTVWHDEFIQMLGRKRRKSGEKVTLFLSTKSLNAFNGVKNKLLLPLYQNVKVIPTERVDRVLCDEEYFRFARRFCIFDRANGFYRINPAGKYVLKKKLDFVDEVLKQFRAGDEKAFVKIQLHWLKKAHDNCAYVVLDEQMKREKIKNLTDYLETLVGKELDKEGQSLLRQKIAECETESVSKVKKLPGLNLVNRFLEMETNYFVQSDYSKKPTVWIIKEKKDE